MFGYVMPVRGEMKVRDFEAYRASYCGVCKQLHKSYGVLSRFLLNYDLVLVSVLADAISGEKGEIRCEGCFASPLVKRHTCHGTKGLELGADALVLLSHHKLRDNLADEGWPKKAGYSLAYPFSNGMAKKAAARRPQLNAVIEEQMQCQQQLENNRSKLIDEACEPTAKMCEAIFREAAVAEEQKNALARLGLFSGQIVYLLDAAEDFDDDVKTGSYNVFVEYGYTKQQAVEAAQRRCRLAAGEMALCYNLLELKQYKDILDNIFFLGLPAGIAAAGIKRKARRTGHGQIESI